MSAFVTSSLGLPRNKPCVLLHLASCFMLHPEGSTPCAKHNLCWKDKLPASSDRKMRIKAYVAMVFTQASVRNARLFGRIICFWGVFSLRVQEPTTPFLQQPSRFVYRIESEQWGEKKRDARGAVSTALWQNPNNGTRDEISDEIFNRSSYLDCSSEISPLLNCEKKSKHGLKPLA